MNSGRTRWGNKIVGVSILLLVITVLSQAVSAYFSPPKAVMHLANARFEIRIADNDRTRIKGLSDTPDLPADEAMVFIFDNDSRHAIWMKDMNYPIDIVWLNSSRKVIDFVTNVPPDSYPKVFLPKEPARYVVELRSGTVKQKGIKAGQEAIFSGINREL